MAQVPITEPELTAEPNQIPILGFRAVFTLAALLCLAAGLLVAVSLFIADRAPWSAQFWTISFVVTAVLLALGLLLGG